MQKAIIVLARWDDEGKWCEDGLEEVNELLAQNWTMVSCTPMGGAAFGYGTSYGYAGGESNEHYSSVSEHSDIAFASVFVLQKL